MRKFFQAVMAVVLMATVTSVALADGPWDELSQSIDDRDFALADSLIGQLKIEQADNPEILKYEGILAIKRAKKRTSIRTNEMSARDSAYLQQLNADYGDTLVFREFVKAVPVIVYEDSLVQLANGLFEAAIEKSPRRLDYRMVQIDGMLEAQQTGTARDAYARMVADVDRDSTGWLWLDDHAIGDSVTEYIAHGFLGVIHSLTNDDVILDDLSQFVDTIQGFMPDMCKIAAREYLGSLYFENQRYDQAIVQWKKILPIACEPDLSRVRYNMAIASLQMGDENSAIKLGKDIVASTQAPPEIVEQAVALVDYFTQAPEEISYKQFQFSFLPQITLVAPSPMYDAALLDPQELISQACQAFKVAVAKDLSPVTAVKVENDSVNAIVWTMPKAEDITDCKYIAFVPTDTCYRVFTLEKTFNLGREDIPEDIFLVCEVKPTIGPDGYNYNHANYGNLLTDECPPDVFAAIVCELLARLSEDDSDSDSDSAEGMEQP